MEQNIPLEEKIANAETKLLLLCLMVRIKRKLNIFKKKNTK